MTWSFPWDYSTRSWNGLNSGGVVPERNEVISYCMSSQKQAFPMHPLPRKGQLQSLPWAGSASFLSVLEASKVFEFNILREISVEKKQTPTKQQQVTPCKAADISESPVPGASSSSHSPWLTGQGLCCSWGWEEEGRESRRSPHRLRAAWHHPGVKKCVLNSD